MEDSLEQFIKLTRNTKEFHKKETQTQKPSTQEIISAHRKIECESRASKIVEFLIEGKLRSEVFLRCLKHINQAYYQDVVEERAIIKVCGFPLCGNQIPPMPTKQFFIDSKHNKVYDLTDRKNYCSNFCYRASTHIKSQIDNTPLWVRKIDESPKFTLLADTERGSPGEEINQGIAKPVQEPTFTSISSFAEISLEDIKNDEVKCGRRTCNKTEKTQKLQTLDETDEFQTCVKPDLEPSSPNSDITPVKPIKPINTKPNQITKAHKHTKTKDFKKIFDSIKKYVQEWMTLETYIFLYGEEQMKQHIDYNCLQDYYSNLKLTESSVTQQKKYLEICKKLHLNQLVEDSFDKSVLGFKIAPVPDYKQLKHDSHNLEVKVRSFYSGDTYEVDTDKKSCESSNDIPKQAVEDTTETPAVLPLVDISSQNALRRKIYLNSISNAVLALTKGLQIPSHHILEQVNSLVKTFRLQAHNVTFEPFLWSLIALILIRMLGIRDVNLKTQLDRKQSKMFINLMLNQLPNADIFLQEVFNNIENIDLFLQRYFDSDD